MECLGNTELFLLNLVRRVEALVVRLPISLILILQKLGAFEQSECDFPRFKLNVDYLPGDP